MLNIKVSLGEIRVNNNWTIEFQPPYGPREILKAGDTYTYDADVPILWGLFKVHFEFVLCIT